MLPVVALLLFASHANAAPPLAEFAETGPHAVAIYDVDWYDAARQRPVPARIYAPADLDAPAPAIVFCHGLGNSRFGYAYLGQHWASHGYVSVHPDHLGADLEVTRHGLWHLFRVGFDRRNWRNVPEDIHFVIDQLQNEDALPTPLRGRIDPAHIGVAGHSLGAYGALAVGGLRVLFPDRSVMNFRDPRVRAAIPISMSENFNPASYSDIAIPMLHLTGTHDSSIVYGTWPRKRRIPFNSIRRDDQYLVVIRGANHSTFSDDESPSNRAMHDVIRMSTVLFWNAYLRQDPSALAALRDGQLNAALDGVARVTVKHEAPLRIGTISIQASPLFDADEAHRGAFYRRANVMAVPTREALLRKFLLFREGDIFDPYKLAETERNLRALDFLKTVSVKAGEPHEGVVDITVATQDAWTTDVNADFSNDGGRSLYDFDVTQKDLGGSGAEVDVRTANGRMRRTNSVELLHPALFGPYWNGDALLSKNSDGNEERLSVEHPLFSYATRWTTAVLEDHLLQTSRTYDSGAVATEFRQQHRQLGINGGLVIAAGPQQTTRLVAGADSISDRFESITGAPPAGRHFRFLQMGIDSTAFDFVKADHVDLGLREQDFNLGTHASLDVGRTPSRVWRIRSDDSVGRWLGEGSFLLSHFTASSRAGSANRNAVWSDDLRLVARMPSALPQTFVGRVRVDIGSDLDRDVQFFADGQNGLRAYPNFALEGNRRVLLNVEDRFFLGRELLQIFEPGVAVFFDSGEAISRGPLRPRELHSDVGAGLRFSIARFESAVFRLDFAYALNDSPISRRGMVVSFATMQAF